MGLEHNKGTGPQIGVLEVISTVIKIETMRKQIRLPRGGIQNETRKRPKEEV